MLLAMIVTWAAQGKQRYPWQDSTFPYISDIGASFLQPLFIAGSAVTAVSFVLSLTIERLLRHNGRLHADLRRREKAFSYLAIFGAFLGGAGLVLLSIFNDNKHKGLHDTFLLVFIVGVALSAIFTVVEVSDRSSMIIILFYTDWIAYTVPLDQQELRICSQG
jgi:FtsH-binding integral membrane protein